MGESIRVLHVDDDPDRAELTARMLERAGDDLDVEPVTTAAAAVERLGNGRFDCVVSDYDMTRMTGIDLLAEVREVYPDLPFILYTGKGSEDIAADAFSSGATDYLQKEGGERQYEVLVNRIENAVKRYKTAKASELADYHRREMLDRITDGYARLDGDLRLIDVNEATAEFVGTTREDLIGRHYRDLITDSNDTTILQAYETVLETGESIAMEERSAVNPQRWVEERIFPADDGGLYAFFRDNTEQKRREHELEEERDRLSAIYDAVPEPLANILYEDGIPVIQRVNEVFESVFGYDAETARGTSINELIVPPERMEEAKALDQRSAANEQVSAEVWRETTEGERLFRFSAASVTQTAERNEWISTYVDITDRKLREEALERHRENLERLHEAANRLYAAESIDECYDITIDAGISILGFDWCTLAAPAEESELFEIKAISDGTPISVGDRPFRVDEGIAGRVYQSKQPSVVDDARDEGDAEPTAEVIRSVLTVPVRDWGVLQAISEEPSAFDEHDRHHAELLVASMLTAVDRISQQRELERQRDRLEEFASVVSHDLRNPLAIADGRIELAQDEHASDHLDEAQNALARMDGLIEDLLTLAREGETVGEREVFELGDLITESWQTMSSTEATLDVEGTRPIRGDPHRVRQLLENLFRNALDHAGPAVSVRVGLLDDGFFVEDNGPGIPAEQYREVFTTGYSTADDGTGFGLSIVKRIVDAHGWTVTATESTAGGARFEITDVELPD